MRTKESVSSRLIWILAGLVLACSIAAMVTSQSFNLLDFYDDGTTFYIDPNDREEMGLKGITYNHETKVFTIESSDAKMTFPKAKKGFQYYYVRMGTNLLNLENMDVKFCYYDKAGQRIAEQIDILGSGECVATIPAVGEIYRLKIVFSNKEGAAFQMEDVELREKLPCFSIKRFAITAVLVFLFFIGIGVIINRKKKETKRKKRVFEDITHCLQYIYMWERRPADFLYSHLNKKHRHWLRISLFAILCTYMAVMDMLGFYEDKNYYKYHMFFASAVILIIGWLLYEGELNYKKWNSPFMKSWFVLWTVVCISDAVAGNFYVGTGYMMLFAMGSLFFFWGNQKKRRDMLVVEMLKGIEIFLIVYAVIFLVCAFLPENGEIYSIVPMRDSFMGEWKIYFMDLNLAGHSSFAENGGWNLKTYNSILEMAYRYGIMVLIPYILFMVHVVKQNVRYMVRSRGKRNIAGVLLAISVLYLLALFVSNQEQPFLSPIWLAFYVHVGYFANLGNASTRLSS